MTQKNKINVLQIVPGLDPGGAEQVALSIAVNINDDNFRTGLVSLYDHCDEKMLESLNKKGVPVFRLGKHKGFDPGIYKKLYDAIGEFHADVVHTHIGALRYAFVPAKIKRVRLIVHTLHNYAEKEVVPWAAWISRIAFIAGVVPVATSKQCLESFEAKYGVKNIPLIYNGIGLQNFEGTATSRQRWRKINGFNDDSVIFVNVARLRPQKNQAMLIKAFCRMRRGGRGSHLVIVGDGPQKEALNRLISEEGASKCVHLLGQRDDIPEILSSSDVFVLSSDYEGTPLSVIEAMISGLPVISTPVGIIPEILERGASGEIVGVKDQAAMCAAMEKMAADEGARKEQGLQARKTAEKRFDAKRMVKEYEDLYMKRIFE